MQDERKIQDSQNKWDLLKPSKDAISHRHIEDLMLGERRMHILPDLFIFADCKDSFKFKKAKIIDSSVNWIKVYFILTLSILVMVYMCHGGHLEKYTLLILE